jgi:hypothetical protein
MFFMDKQQSPSKNWMPTGGEAGGGLACQLAEVGEQTIPKIQNITQNLPPSTDTDN